MTEQYLKSRPKKKPFTIKVQERLRNEAIDKLKLKLLPNDKIIKILLIGGSVKGTFGQYADPGFRGSLYSDFDFIVFVEEDYKIPKWLKKEPTGKPFPDDKLNLAYRDKKFIDNKYDVEIFFIRRKNMEDVKIQKLGEMAGIPMTENSKHKKLVVYGGKE
tara:strand:- start:367 stop:846 length:480 start_codon:yes stop_codon:yes gene_type:complete